jgi:diguanylate cyclase (GGDEF)-like protein
MRELERDKIDPLQVLIIEDDKDTAQLFSTVLGLVGFDCEVVLSGKEALAHLASGVPDLILLDMRLGVEISGEDILYQIRSNPRLLDTRVIIITAYPEMVEPINNLADLILTKPIEVEQLKTLAQRMGSLEITPKRLLFHDPVTELFNQEFFSTRLELAFERSKRRPDFLFAVIVFDLKLEGQQADQNDPDISFAVLREVAQRLSQHVRPTDALARLSGWKFASLHEDLIHPDDIQAILARLREMLSEPYQIDDCLYDLTIRAGWAIHDRQYETPKEILKRAEQNLERA